MPLVERVEHLSKICGSDHCPILLAVDSERLVPSDAQLAEEWDNIDWTAAEQKLADLQRRLSIAEQGRSHPKAITPPPCVRLL